MKTDKLTELQLTILDAIGMGDRTDISEVTIHVTATEWPTVQIVSKHEITEGLGKFGFYLTRNKYVLIPQDESDNDTADIGPNDQPSDRDTDHV